MLKDRTEHWVIKATSHIAAETERGQRRNCPNSISLCPLRGAASPVPPVLSRAVPGAGLHSQNSLEGGRDGVLTGVEAVRVLILRNTAWRRCRRCARELAASGVFFQ